MKNSSSGARTPSVPANVATDARSHVRSVHPNANDRTGSAPGFHARLKETSCGTKPSPLRGKH